MRDLYCPSCNTFLGEVDGAARLVCRKCGAETQFTPKADRAALRLAQAAPPKPIRVRSSA